MSTLIVDRARVYGAVTVVALEGERSCFAAHALRRRHRRDAGASAGDPTQAFDGGGRLYYGFICFNRAKPTNGSIYVARYDDDGASYRFTTRVERGTPSVAGLFQDKINITADQRNGNVYVAWARFSGNLGNDVIMFSRSTDGGRTYSKPGPDLRRRRLRAVRRPRGRARRRRLPDLPDLRRLAGSRRDRDRQVDDRRRLVDAPAHRRDDHRKHRGGHELGTGRRRHRRTLLERHGMDRDARQRGAQQPEFREPRQRAIPVLRRLQLRLGGAGRQLLHRLDGHARPRLGARPA